MKQRISALLMAAIIGMTALTGCSAVSNARSELEQVPNKVMSELASELDGARKEIISELDDARKQITSEIDDAKEGISSALDGETPAATEATSAQSGKAYTMADVKKLTGTSNFAKNTLEHIFDGTINSKGKATGYHYSNITDSKGSIIPGTESQPDKHGVFTAKVKVNDVKKNGFSSFYPAAWSPQQVVDAINQAYDDALSDPDNPQGELWIGYSGDLEIDMYLDKNKKITTAYPIYEEVG
ncbi:MAG: EndoU domain-containing protein [Ruminococcus sp.]|nr:EndoU domain-containing protein [Ruminococcus sp.]